VCHGLEYRDFLCIWHVGFIAYKGENITRWPKGNCLKKWCHETSFYTRPIKLSHSHMAPTVCWLHLHWYTHKQDGPCPPSPGIFSCLGHSSLPITKIPQHLLRSPNWPAQATLYKLIHLYLLTALMIKTRSRVTNGWERGEASKSLYQGESGA
jgi:hypothetical protein